MFELFYWIEEIITKKWALVSLDLDKRAKSCDRLKNMGQSVNKNIHRWVPGRNLLIKLILHDMHNVKIISLKAPFTYEFDDVLCVSCMSYIIALTFGQS